MSLFYLRGAYYYTQLPKPNGSVFRKTLLRLIRRKESLSSADADEDRRSAILDSNAIFFTL
jgi:hypothetical protein